MGSAATPEPTNYPTNLSAQNIKLQWTDATGTAVPEHYLIRMSAAGFDAITAPVDGTAYANTANDQNIAYGVQQVSFNNLNAHTTYYFKIYGYTGSGATADYKINGNVPQTSIAIP